MKPQTNLSRRTFLAQTGSALACAGAALTVPHALLGQTPARKKANIKFSMYLYTLMNAPWPMAKLNIIEVCRRTKGMGIDSLDFIGAGYNKTWTEIRKIADDHGLKTICYTRGIGDLESPEASVRVEGLEQFKERLETAHILGANRIMLNQGGKASGNPSATNRKWMIESMGEAMPLAKAAGIEVTIETHNSAMAPFRNSSHFDQALAQLPDLRVCFDSGNSFTNGEDPLQGYLNNRQHVTHMHFKDFARGELGNSKSICPPGTGLVDLPGIITAMRESGYDGYINIEKGGPDGFEVYKKSMGILAPLIA